MLRTEWSTALKDYETEANLVHDRGHHALEEFHDGNCFY